MQFVTNWKEIEAVPTSVVMNSIISHMGAVNNNNKIFRNGAYKMLGVPEGR